MRKQPVTLKRVLSMIMVFAMVLTLLPTSVWAAPETITVYFRNDWLWPSVQAYYWGSTTGTNPGWPGVDMTKVDTVSTTDGDRDVYAIEIPADVTGLIFSGIRNGGSDRQQTPDIKSGIAHENAYTIYWDNANAVKTIDYSPKYDVSVNLTNLTKTAGAAEATKGEAYTATLTADEGYTLPETLTITVGGVAFSGYTFENGVVTIPGASVIGDITITAVAVRLPAEYSVTFNGTNVTSNGGETATEGKDYTATLTAAEGYTLPENITVTVGGSAISTYTYTNGVVTVPAASVTGDIVITAVGVEEDDGMITVYFRNDWLWPSVQAYYWGSTTGTNPGWPGVDMTKVDTVSTADGDRDVYAIEIPADVTGLIFSGIRNGGSDRQQTPNIESGIADGNAYTIYWNNANAWKEIEYTPAVKDPVEYTVTFNGTNVTSDGASTVEEGATYTATLTAAKGYTLPESVTVTVGGEAAEHTYDAATGVLSIANVTGNVVITAVGVEEDDGMITVYFRNDWKWTDIRIYYWLADGTDNGWPGTVMTKVDNDGTYDIYSAEIPADTAGFIFNGIKDDGSGSRDQSPDMTNPADGDAYYMHWDGENKCSKFDYTPGGSGEGGGGDADTTAYYLQGYLNNVDYSGSDYKFENGSLTVTFTADSYVYLKDGNNVNYMFASYCQETSGTLTTSGNEKMFVPGNVKLTFTLVENTDGSLTLSYVQGGSGEGGGETGGVEYKVTFHFVNSLNWNVVNLYTWTGSSTTHTGGWPGTAVSADGSGYYTHTVTYEAAANSGLNFIFNNGSAQTVDLVIPASEFVNNKAEKWVVLTTKDGEGKYNAAIVDDPSMIVTSPVVEDDSVTFNYGGSAQSVVVAGSFNGWSTTDNPMTKNADGIWTVTVSDLEAGDYQYKFVVDGNWILDPMNSNVATEADGNQNSVFYILSSSDTEDNNTITINIHYSRTDGNYDGWNLWVWGSNMGGHQVDFTSTDANGAKVATIVLEDARAYQDISFKERLSVEGNDWKDQGSSDRTIDLSTVVSGTIDYYLPSGECVYGDDVIRKNKVSSVGVDYDNNAITITTVQAIANPETALTLMKGEEEIEVTVQSVGSKYSMVLPEGTELNLAELYKYQVMFEGAPYSIAMDAAYASDKFANEFTYTGDDLGAAYSAAGTTFRVWAPTAESVSVKLYATGSDAEAGAADKGTHTMTKDVNGTWVVTVEGDLKNVYYTYSVKVNGETVEANDPYSQTTGVNGARSMVIDLDSTDPAGWDSDRNPNPVTSQTDAVIYELHVRDFSIDASSGVSEANRGKFMAFTETGTTVNGTGTTSTGIDYLEDLGITHLHLLPIYDYASVDETTCSNFNWGYDPQNYNVPEGSYSTNPYDGNVRVNEMKQMVMALHESGISVVMDVVYNHVYDASTFSFNQIVPGYFSRVSSNASGCGNDTASEREMVRKYIVESVLYWTEEYHIDGFRFDLVGLIDVDTINQIVEEVHAVRPDVIFYGEGWDMDSTNKEPGTNMAKQGNASKTPGFAYFSDSMRNNLGGNNEGTATGFASGAGNGGSMVTEWLGSPWWTNNPQQVVQYASCHDNYTLADKIILSTGRTALDATVIKMNNLAAAFYMTSQGIPFIHAGEEILRQKINEDGSRNHNSYNSPDSVNHIDWTDMETYADNSAYYKGLIALRKAHPALSMDTAAQVEANIYVREESANLLAFWIDGREITGETHDSIYVIFNANSSAQTVELPAGNWDVCVNDKKAGTETISTVSGSVSVAGISAMVLVQKNSTEEPSGSGSKSDVALPGSFNEWNGNNFMNYAEGSDTVVTQTMFLAAGTYEFKIKIGDTWYGNNGTIEDSTDKTSADGWEMSSSEGSNCKLQATGGAYTFIFNTETNKLIIQRAASSSSDYFLHGYINGVDYVGGDYKFDADGKLTTTFSVDSYVYVINGDASATYMTDGYLGFVDSAVMYDTAKHTLTGEKWDKLLIPGGTEVTFTLTVNNDNTVTLSYTAADSGVEDQSGIQDGVTLHCWNWSFAEIEKNIPLIAQLGYTAIQTSPVQPLKEATNLPINTVGGNWWVYYQPVDFVITTDSGNALGTKEDLVSMIQVAHQYGIQVIVDVVANHLGNQTGNNLSDKIPEYLLKDEYWHDITVNTTDYKNRYDMTQHCMGGLPDLNTANSDVQGYVLDFLKECVDAGVDGFRFDAAKHIETPKDDATFSSNFWTVVVDGAENYALETYSKDLYIYGEILDDPAIAISAYTRYMAVTDNGWGNHLRSMVDAGTASMVGGYYKSAPASQLVIWAESHDTYATDDANQSSAGVSEAVINKTWALVAARADAMGLYLARPESMDQKIGVASLTGWDNPEVKAVNKFHNAFAGQTEVVSNENGISYVERGTTGVVLVQVSGAATVADEISVTAHAMADGTYTDQITGNTFTVANGKITGQIGATGIAVVYNAAAEKTYDVTISDVTGGEVQADKETAQVGETVTVTVKADEGKVIDQVTVTDASGAQVTLTDEGNGVYTFVQPASDVTVNVTFKDEQTGPVEPTKYNVTVSDVTGGEVQADKETAEEGETVTITVTPAEGKEIDKITVTDESGSAVTVTDAGNGKYTFAQPASGVTVTVTFKDKASQGPVEPETFEVKIEAGQGGKVKIDNEKPEKGDTVTITVTPDKDKELLKLTVTDEKGNEITVTDLGNGKYTYVQPEGNVTIKATFKAVAETPSTGDQSLMGLWVVLAMISAAAFVALLQDQRRKAR